MTGTRKPSSIMARTSYMPIESGNLCRQFLHPPGPVGINPDRIEARNAPCKPYPMRFEDLSPLEIDRIKHLSRFILRKISRAVEALSGAQDKPSPLVMRHFKITDINPESQSQL